MFDSYIDIINNYISNRHATGVSDVVYSCYMNKVLIVNSFSIN